MRKYRADMHIHSWYSFDSKMKFRDIADTLEEKGIQYAGISDHIEISHNQLKEIQHSLKKRSQEIDTYEKTTTVEFLKGLEISEPHLHEEDILQIIERNDIDYILGSVHHLLGIPIKKMIYSPKIEDLYLKSLLRMVETADIDAVAHLDYLKRYISNPAFNHEMLKEILLIMVEREIALEVNTSGYRRCDEYFPSKEILELYANIGGKRIIIGSDAHKPQELHENINDALDQIEPYNFDIGIIKKRSFRKI